jgi:cytochrome P450
MREQERDSTAMTATDLYSQVVTMFAGSFENVANTVAWTALLLAQNPVAMAELVRELDSELEGDVPTISQLEGLPFLDAVLKESMRILPSAPILIRAANDDTSLGGFPLRMHDHVALSVYHTHRMTNLYARPDQFDPWRWFSINPGPYEYLPFGAGPRACIAKVFSWLQIKLMTAMLLSRWKVRAVHNTRVDYSSRIVLRPTTGLHMTVQKHDGQFKAVPIRGTLCDLVDFEAMARTNVRPRLFQTDESGHKTAQPVFERTARRAA